MFGRAHVRAAVFVATAAVVVTACDPGGQPSVPTIFGARVTDGRLQLWTGSPCPDVYSVAVVFSDNTRPGQDDLNMVRVSNSAVPFERYALGDAVPGLDVNKPLPEGFDWRTAKDVALTVHENGGQSSGSHSDLAEVVAGSAKHPADTYWFDGVGWLTPAQVAAMDGKQFFTLCSPARPK